MKQGLKQALGALLAASWMAWSALSPAAAGEVRELALYQVHTKETLKVVYKKNGRYIPSAMKKINYILRDWRRDAVTKIDPKTIDLMWELHADLGSKKPVHIISAYRSAKTNAMLKRIGRRVARRSRHIRGQAIDMYFPDVPTSRVRGSALVRKIGGVGYYPRSGKHGFVHIDSGNVRHWPRVNKTRMARILKKHRKTVGARRYRKHQPVIMLASAKTRKQVASKKPSGPISITPKGPKKKAVLASANTSVPKPRNRPMEVLVMASAANVQVTPVAAEVPTKNYSGDTIARISDMDSLITATTTEASDQHSNIAAKGSLTRDILDGTVEGTPTIRPLLTAKARPQEEIDDTWWPMQWLATADSLLRRDGTPQPFEADIDKPEITDRDELALKSMMSTMAPANQITNVEALRPTQVTMVSGKADKLTVVRTSKGDLLLNAPMSILKRRTSSANKQDNVARLDARAEAILQSIEKPMSFDR